MTLALVEQNHKRGLRGEEGRLASGWQRTSKKRPAAKPGVSCPWASLMSIEVVRDVLLWWAVINYGLLRWWFLFFTLAHDWTHRFHGRWFRLPVEPFDAIRYAGITMYKIGIILLNLVPYKEVLFFGPSDPFDHYVAGGSGGVAFPLLSALARGAIPGSGRGITKHVLACSRIERTT